MRANWLVSKGDKPITRLPPEWESAPLCKCGCGKTVDWGRSKSKWYVYVEGHYRVDAKYKHKDWLTSQYASGRTFTEIATECGANPSTVLKFRRKFGIILRQHGDDLRLRGSVKGDKNPSWKGGVTPERQRIYKTHEWNELISATFARDHGTCQRCGTSKSKTIKIHAHHIKSWADYPEYRFSIENLVTLCVGCHTLVHSNQNVRKEYVYA